VTGSHSGAHTKLICDLLLVINTNLAKLIALETVQDDEFTFAEMLDVTENFIKFHSIYMRKLWIARRKSVFAGCFKFTIYNVGLTKELSCLYCIVGWVSL